MAGSDYLVVSASTLYSVMRDPAAWKSPQLHGLRAGWRLYLLLQTDLDQHFVWPGHLTAEPIAKWTPAQCETLAAILLGMYRALPPFVRASMWWWMADALVKRDFSTLYAPEVNEHTRAFLLVHRARMLYADERNKRLYHLPQDCAPSSVEDDERTALRLLKEADVCTGRVAEADQQSRCYRAIAIAYVERNQSEAAMTSFAKMDLVAGISASTRRKNYRARKQWGW